MSSASSPPGRRSGFVALAGRPNVGKSTLMNRVVGEKVAIVSDRPQTTRRAVRGVATGDRWQLVIIDLPGVQRPRDLLTERMQRRAERELADADAVLFVLNGEQGVGPGDRFIAGAVKRSGLPAVVAVNKLDLLPRARLAAALAAAGELAVEGEIVPISAHTGEGVDELVAQLVALVPEGEFLYPEGTRSDVPEERRLA
jgi:GTPase